MCGKGTPGNKEGSSSGYLRWEWENRVSGLLESKKYNKRAGNREIKESRAVTDI